MPSTPEPLELNPYLEHFKTIEGAFEDMAPLAMRAMGNLNALKPFVDENAEGEDLARFNQLAHDVIRFSGGIYDVWATETAFIEWLLSPDEEAP